MEKFNYMVDNWKLIRHCGGRGEIKSFGWLGFMAYQPLEVI